MYSPDISSLILVWIGGIAAVQGFTEKLKWLYRNADDRLKKVLNYLASILISLFVSGFFLYLTNSFSLKATVLYAVPIWLAASGIYDAYHIPKTQ